MVRQLPHELGRVGRRVLVHRQDAAVEHELEALRVPLADPADRFACYKVSKRFEQDISALLAAYRLRLDADGRVALLSYLKSTGVDKLPDRQKLATGLAKAARSAAE